MNRTKYIAMTSPKGAALSIIAEVLRESSDGTHFWVINGQYEGFITHSGEVSYLDGATEGRARVLLSFYADGYPHKITVDNYNEVLEDLRRLVGKSKVPRTLYFAYWSLRSRARGFLFRLSHAITVFRGAMRGERYPIKDTDLNEYDDEIPF